VSKLIRLGLSDEPKTEADPAPDVTELDSIDIVDIFEQEFNPQGGRYEEIGGRLVGGDAVRAFREALESGNMTIEEWSDALIHYDRIKTFLQSLKRPIKCQK